MAVSLPGYLSYDSVIQLMEGRTEVYSGWHPPIMSWLLGLSDAIVSGTSLFVAASALLLFGSMLSLLRVVRRVSWLSVPCALLCVLTPQFLLYQGTVWKDVLFANATVVAFAALAHVAVKDQRHGSRWFPLALAILLLSLATLSRQNGFLLLPFGGIALAWIAIRNGTKRVRAVLVGAGVVLASALLAWLAATTLAARTVDGGETAKQVRVLEAYDLAGAFAGNPEFDSPALRQRDSKLFEHLQRDGARFYSPTRSDTLARSAPLQLALAEAPENVLHKPWRDFIFSKPGAYLRQRAEVFRWIYFTPRIELCVPYIVGVRGPFNVMQQLGLGQRFSWRDKIADAYGKRLLRTPLFSHPAFLILALGELGFLFFRRRTTDVPFACLLAGAIVFSSSFFFLSIACDYRYLYLLDLSALATLFYIALAPACGLVGERRSLAQHFSRLRDSPSNARTEPIPGRNHMFTIAGRAEFTCPRHGPAKRAPCLRRQKDY